ncbi:MAG: hypothetical protein JO057_14060 [Chloroflexi bacterium]|nr:hypothetical protein [Chloroflexota bacterium]
MAGITNRDPNLEKQNQQRVEARKRELPGPEQVNHPEKDHAIHEDGKGDLAKRGRVSETGTGPGTEHQGH